MRFQKCLGFSKVFHRIYVKIVPLPLFVMPNAALALLDLVKAICYIFYKTALLIAYCIGLKLIMMERAGMRFVSRTIWHWLLQKAWT